MTGFLMSNASTIIISILLVVMVVSIIIKLYNDKKKGRSSCGAGCSHCPMSAECHKRKPQTFD
ncbi:MAG: FeoB-associated Cys-rich membrane protein [Lachnospiraceae bacterium]|nr:FeoB-associated Cys-rich membrane protein [Lachnospiraceae bacterium]MCR5410088.1 FeoB-associated Cys-rich membrane protein [Lachnospiraceae bacterium]